MLTMKYSNCIFLLSGAGMILSFIIGLLNAYEKFPGKSGTDPEQCINRLGILSHPTQQPAQRVVWAG